MILIPEIETTVVLVPRTGSLSLWRGIGAKYPKSALLYRHMEADGVPFGYDRWPKVGVVRHPVERLWSLYKFLRNLDDDGWSDPAFAAAMRASAACSFDDYVTKNDVVFASPDDRTGFGRYLPQFAVRHALPENRKSQRLYLRPDLGTEVFRFDQLGELAERLGIGLAVTNATEASEMPALSPEADSYVHRVFAWDFEAAEPGGGETLSLDRRRRRAVELELAGQL